MDHLDGYRDTFSLVASLEVAPLFPDLSPPTLGALAAHGRRQCVPGGQVIFVRGDRADVAYLLLRGHVKLVRETDDGAESIITVIQPGDIFGAAAWGEASYPATAAALEDAAVIRWATPDFTALVASHPDFALAVIRMLGRHLRVAAARIHELQTAPAEQRLARALRRLADTAGTPTVAGIEIGLLLSRQHVAELAGTTLSTASRVLSAWERQGVLCTHHQRITITWPCRLGMLARDKTAAYRAGYEPAALASSGTH